jgi:hypothetical protein
MVVILESTGSFLQKSHKQLRLTGTDPVDSALSISEPTIRVWTVAEKTKGPRA